MDYTLDEALNNLWDRTRRALEDAQRNARLVERLEEETKKLKELTNSIHEKRMQDEKELEEIRLRMEILEREEQEQKKAKMQQEEEKRKNEDWKRRMMTRWVPWCWNSMGKWKFTLTLVISIGGTTILHDLLLSQTRRRKLPRRRKRPEQCRLRRRARKIKSPYHLHHRPFRISVRLQKHHLQAGTILTKKECYVSRTTLLIIQVNVRGQ